MKKFISVFLLAVFSSAANAAFISMDYAALGDELITLDTTTNLEWLDVSATAGLSAQSVLAGSGGWINEFRYATRDEIETLWSGFGLYTGNTYQADKYAGAAAFNDYLNTANTSCSVAFTCGFYVANFGAHIDLINVGTSAGSGFSYIWSNYSSLGFTNSYYGSFLVRNSVNVSEPAGILVLGMLGLFSQFIRRKRLV